jgi:hypothetical protein
MFSANVNAASNINGSSSHLVIGLARYVDYCSNAVAFGIDSVDVRIDRNTATHR